jgi:hypothetical protein
MPTLDEKVDDLVLIARLRLYLEKRTPEELMAACQDGDEEALDVLCWALPALRRRAGLTVAQFMGKDLAETLGLQAPRAQ